MEMYCDYCGGIFDDTELTEDEGQMVCDECQEKREATIMGGPY